MLLSLLISFVCFLRLLRASLCCGGFACYLSLPLWCRRPNFLVRGSCRISGFLPFFYDSVPSLVFSLSFTGFLHLLGFITIPFGPFHGYSLLFFSRWSLPTAILRLFRSCSSLLCCFFLFPASFSLRLVFHAIIPGFWFPFRFSIFISCSPMSPAIGFLFRFLVSS